SCPTSSKQKTPHTVTTKAARAQRLSDLDPRRNQSGPHRLRRLDEGAVRDADPDRPCRTPAPPARRAGPTRRGAARSCAPLRRYRAGVDEEPRGARPLAKRGKRPCAAARGPHTIDLLSSTEGVAAPLPMRV